MCQHREDKTMWEEIVPLWPSLAGGLATRLCLMLYGLWQDSTMSVKYTDVDYYVFTDAARFMYQGESPYKRATYRYTPLLAWMLQPNIFWSQLYGKLLFILCDIVSGYLIFALVRLRSGTPSMAVLCAQLWLLNPLPMTVSSRGNAESILAVLVLSTLYFILCQSHRGYISGALLYAVSVHFKIYPVTYALALYLFLDDNYRSQSSAYSKKCRTIFSIDIWPNRTRLIFIFICALTFFTLTGLCYMWYGMEFLHETYLYHVTRRDTRHNFSPYFYMLYLTGDSTFSMALGLLAFIPQVALLVLASVKFFKDLPFSCFLQTFIFVTFNKVCTSQYFLWYLSLLPLVVPHLNMSGGEALCLVALWFLGQFLWLTPAYYLEFEGRNTFLLIWIASLVFLTINVWILHRIITCYRFQPIYDRKGKMLALQQRDALTLGAILDKAIGIKHEHNRKQPRERKNKMKKK